MTTPIAPAFCAFVALTKKPHVPRRISAIRPAKLLAASGSHASAALVGVPVRAISAPPAARAGVLRVPRLDKKATRPATDQPDSATKTVARKRLARIGRPRGGSGARNRCPSRRWRSRRRRGLVEADWTIVGTDREHAG